jgi:hypothetical protein
MIDLLHAGHIKALKQARAFCDRHIFGLIEDKSVIEWKGTLISPFEQRKETLSCIFLIDEIMPQSTFDPYQNLKKIRDTYPDAQITLFKEESWGLLPNEDFLHEINVQTKLLRYDDRLSPEKIAEKTNISALPRYKMKTIVSSKANTLLNLKLKLKKSKIEEILIVTRGQFLNNRSKTLDSVKSKFSSTGRYIVVRSSSSAEDCFDKSNAGRFASILNVDPGNTDEINRAISAVFNSYSKYADGQDEQVLIQPQTENIALAGVIFTRDIKNNVPYYMVEYDDDGCSDSVTSGRKRAKSVYILRNANLKTLKPKWRFLLASVREIERILNGIVLDVEFAITQAGQVVIFQVRPVTTSYRFKIKENDVYVLDAVSEVQKGYEGLLCKHRRGHMILSDMAFWNPAEIIGVNPKPLDFSLYREIITSSAWNGGLIPMGYKAVARDLMYKLGNKPYISVDYSFKT